uniref:Uncharacterized protein n=1 Tax=Arundo donax TaxID=35708 RepID=A0A0A8ZTV3_ARUDO
MFQKSERPFIQYGRCCSLLWKLKIYGEPIQ